MWELFLETKTERVGDEEISWVISTKECRKQTLSTTERAFWRRDLESVDHDGGSAKAGSEVYRADDGLCNTEILEKSHRLA